MPDDMTVDIVSIVGIFISVLLALGLMNTVSDYATGISEYANSSEIVVMIAPFIPVIWLVGCFGIAGAMGYGIYKRHSG